MLCTIAWMLLTTRAKLHSCNACCQWGLAYGTLARTHGPSRPRPYPVVRSQQPEAKNPPPP
eukprot:10646226-Lingulodinium_polyedra.AAC.1